jgi:hypothetical protein
MFRRVVCLLIAFVGTAHATVRHVPIRSGVLLKPGEAYTAEVESSSPVEIGWTAVQATACTMDCIRMTLVSNPSPLPFSAALGAVGNYSPTNGRIAVEYRNVSQQPVTIDVYRIVRICDAASCRLFDSSNKGKRLVIKIDEFKSITNSADTSYSVISGVAESGRAFRIHVVWWTEEKGSGFMGCPRFIKGWVDNHTPKSQYRLYVIAGQNVGDENNIILKSLDTCVPHADHFGASEQTIFK